MPENNAQNTETPQAATPAPENKEPSPSSPGNTTEKKKIDLNKYKEFGKGHKILVVDDEPTTTELIQNLLGKMGFEVILASHGKQAWEKLSPESIPLLILSDVIMPEMDGFQFFKELKRNEESKNIPLVIMTARKKMEDTFLALGVDGFLGKPIETEKLLELVLNLAARRMKIEK